MLHTVDAQMFVRFALRLNIEKSAPKDPRMTLTCSRSKVPKCIVDTFPMPNFLSISLYGELF